MVKQARNPWSTNCVYFSAPTRPPLPKSRLIHHEVQRVCWLVQRPLHWLPRGNKILQHRSGHFPLVRRCRPLLGRRGPLGGPAPTAHAVGSFSRTGISPRRGCAAPYPMGPPDGPRVHDVQRSRVQRLKSIVRCPMSSVQVVQCPVANVQCPGAQGPVSITPPPRGKALPLQVGGHRSSHASRTLSAKFR